MNEKPSVGIGHYVVVLKRQWKIIVAMALLGVLAVVAFLYLVPSRVMASTLVNVNVIVSDPFNPSRPASGLLDAATEDQLASSYVVAHNAAQTLQGGDDAAALRDGVSVTAGLNATTVRISYTSSSAERARAGADALANSYLLYRQSEADARKTKMINQLQQQLTSLNAVMGATALADRSALSGRISSVEYQINQLTAIDTTGGSVLTPAAENPVSVQPQTSTFLASGLLVGLVLGVILAFIRNAFNRRILDGYDVGLVGAGPVLAELDGSRGTIPARGDDVNEFRMIRERMLASAGTSLEALTVIDTTQGGLSDVAPNLAVVMAQTGADVELVVMGTSEMYMTLLRDGLQLVPDTTDSDEEAEILGSLRIPHLKVTRPDRTGTHDGADDLVTGVVRRRTAGRKPGTVIILALPADAPYASRLAAGRLAGAGVMVAERLRSRADDLAAGAAQLDEVGAVLLGVVLLQRGRTITDTHETSHPATLEVPGRDAVSARR
ncbi:hypothetical protein [Arthrobacter sp. A5]|uniref:hypothetical protein n=1 Tax=Arthrobacter sp. A5 TaxID=576926 RepID=UPI003DAA042B